MINLKVINEDNFLDAFQLKLADGQEKYVSNPIRSLAQAYVYRKQCQPFGIYDGDEMVGYVMVIYDYDIPEYDIWHMMIDASRQGRGYGSEALRLVLEYIKTGSIIFLMGLAPNVLGYRHPAAILDRSKNKCCGLITDGEELKNNQLCFSVDTTVLHLFSDLSRTCPRTSGGWVPPLALMPKNNRSVSFLVA